MVNPAEVDLVKNYLLVREDDSGNREFKSVEKGSLGGRIIFFLLTTFGGYNADIDKVQEAIKEVIDRGGFSNTEKNILHANLIKFQQHEVTVNHRHQHVFRGTIEALTADTTHPVARQATPSPASESAPKQPPQPAVRSLMAKPPTRTNTQQAQTYYNNEQKLNLIFDNLKPYFKSDEDRINALSVALEDHYGIQFMNEVLDGYREISDQDVLEIGRKVKRPKAQRQQPKAQPMRQAAPAQSAPPRLTLQEKQAAIRKARPNVLILQASSSLSLHQTAAEEKAMPSHIAKKLESYLKDPLPTYAKNELENVENIDDFLHDIALRELLDNTKSVKPDLANNLFDKWKRTKRTT